MHRFFITPELLTDLHLVSLPKNIAHQVRDVLHLAIGEQLLLLDNTDHEVLATVAKSNREGVDVQLLERRTGKSAPTVRIILCQALLKSARFEWILEKGTELGVAIFAPTLYHRSMAGLQDTSPAKQQRWQRIIQEAAEQCGRSRLPELLPIRPLTQALNAVPPNALAIMPWEEEHNQNLRQVLTSPTALKNVGVPLAGTPSIAPQPITVILFIGPEGGLTVEEVILAQQHGVQIVTLGPLIMRAETAALAAVANIMYEMTGQ